MRKSPKYAIDEIIKLKFNSDERFRRIITQVVYYPNDVHGYEPKINYYTKIVGDDFSLPLLLSEITIDKYYNKHT
jgi:hypothetical protein